MDFVSSFTNQVVQKAMDGHWKRHAAISSNLANVETPNYKHQSVVFEQQLGQAIQKHHENPMGRRRSASNDDHLSMRISHDSHFSIDGEANEVSDVEPFVEVDHDFETRADGNGVDVEREMVAMAQNTQRYIALNNFQGRFFRNMRGLLSDLGNL